ncbi:MAG: phospholipase D-like domain-containing protein [Candidatus Rokuibacteriota bacterium]
MRRGTVRRLLLILLVAAGMLSATACARVRPHVLLPSMVLGEPSFYPTLEAYAQAPIVGGNRIDLLLNGEQIFPAMLAAIRAARTTITYAQYSYGDGPVARDIAQALAERCRAGVKANVLLDGVGALQMPTEYGELMTKAGCHVVFFRPLGLLTIQRANFRNHRRILVVDGRIGFTGGSGVSEQWMGNGRTKDHWRDTDVRIEGPAVDYLQGAFAESWLEATGVVLGGVDFFPRPAPKGQTYAQVVRSSPAGGGFGIYTMLLLAISSARRSIYITNPYFVLDEPMLDALTQAAHRRVTVAVLVPGVIDHALVRQAGRRHFGRLLKAGVEIHEYQPALLHAKTMVIDGVWATVGSTNLDNRSFALNDELNVVVYDGSFARRLEQVFQEDLRYAKKIDYAAWRNRGVGQRVFELLSTPIRDLL